MKLRRKPISKELEREELGVMLQALRVKVMEYDENVRSQAPLYRSIEKQHLRLISAISEIRIGSQNIESSAFDIQTTYAEACAVSTMEQLQRGYPASTPADTLISNHFLLNLIR